MFKEHEITPTKQKLKLSALTNTIVSHYESGKTMAKIAEVMNISKHVVTVSCEESRVSTKTRWDYY